MRPTLLDRYLARRLSTIYWGRPRTRLGLWWLDWQRRQLRARTGTARFEVAVADERGPQKPGRDTYFRCPRCGGMMFDEGCSRCAVVVDTVRL